MTKNSEESLFRDIPKWFFPTLLLFGIFLLFLPYLITLPAPFGIGFSETGQIGDTIGGITTPVIAFAGIILTFFAFWVQYRANLNQQEDIRNQRKDIKIERFENKFYEMIRLHKENLNEIIVGRKKPVKARRAFITMFEEFKFGYNILKNKYHDSLKKDKSTDEILTEKDLINISYIVFFHGIGSSSNPITLKHLSHYPDKFIKPFIEFLRKVQEFSRNPSKTVENVNTYSYVSSFMPNINYIPFQGHMSRLGHYYRHLWRTMKFVDGQSDININDKYNNYMTMLRAQISSYEQLLFYYNCLSQLGNNWIKGGYLQRYCLVKNMPLPLADFGPNPIEVLGEENDEGRKMFE